MVEETQTDSRGDVGRGFCSLTHLVHSDEIKGIGFDMFGINDDSWVSDGAVSGGMDKSA